MVIKLLTFDFTGTLMRFRLAPSVQYGYIAKLYNVDIGDRHLFDAKFKSAFRTMAAEHPNFGAATALPWTQWWLRVVRLAFTSAGVPDSPILDAVAWHLVKLYGTTQGWEMLPGVEAALQCFGSQGLKMGVISNIDPRVDGILQQAGIRHHFEFVLSSYEAGHAKPDPLIFSKALEKLGSAVLPSECCHVGDTLETDYQGAVAAGWKAVLVGAKEANSEARNQCSKIEELSSIIQTM